MLLISALGRLSQKNRKRWLKGPREANCLRVPHHGCRRACRSSSARSLTKGVLVTSCLARSPVGGAAGRGRTEAWPSFYSASCFFSLWGSSATPAPRAVGMVSLGDKLCITYT